jgi:hypothetical protein
MEDSAAMIDLIVLGLFLCIIWQLATLVAREARPSTPAAAPKSEQGSSEPLPYDPLSGIRRYAAMWQTQLVIVAILLAVQLIVVLVRREMTVQSLAAVVPTFLLILDSLFILIAVLTVVGLGVYLSIKQFALWATGQQQLLEMTKKAQSGELAWPNQLDSQAERGLELAKTTFEISSKRVSITTPMIGLVVLTISLAFLYLFLNWSQARPIGG